MKPLPDYERNLGCLPLIVLIIVLLVSCEKEPEPYDIASKGDSIEWHIQTGAYTQIVIQGWGTAQCNGNRIQNPPIYPDSIYKMSAWNGARNIIGLSYDVWLYTDCGWGFVGIGIVQFHNDIILPE